MYNICLKILVDSVDSHQQLGVDSNYQIKDILI